MKRKIIVAAAVVIILSILAGGTLAFWKAEGYAENIITTGSLSLEVHEETDGGQPFPEGGIKDVMPGQEVTKKVSVQNTGSGDMWVRVSVKISVVDENGKDLPIDVITLGNLDTVNWTLKDGYYYYKNAVKPGEMSPELFGSVIFSEMMGNEYRGCTAYVKVQAFGVQSANNGNSAIEAQW